MRWLSVGIWLLASASWAETWVPVSSEGKVSFEAVQQGAPFSGEFQDFRIEIVFDDANPEAGSIRAEVDTASVDTQYGDRDELLRGPEFFHTEAYPQAVLETSGITPTTEGYEATAEFRLRDASGTVTIPFSWEQLGEGQARFRGSFAISRLAYGIGQGDWANTEWIGETVNIAVDLRLTAAPDPVAATPESP